MTKTILITGAGSGFGEGAAIGMARNGHTVIATAQISPQVAALRAKAAELGLEEPAGREARPARPLRHRAGADLGHRRAVEQRRHRRERAGVRDSARPGPAQLRGQRLRAAGAGAGLHQEVRRREAAGQDRLHLVDGRAVHAGGLRHLRLDQACAGVDRRGDAAASCEPYGIKVQTINPGRLPHRLQRDDGGHPVPLARRLQGTSPSAPTLRSDLRRAARQRPRAISIPRR